MIRLNASLIHQDMRSRRLTLPLGVIDQAVVSFGSIAVLTSAAQGLTPEGLGMFALAISSVLFAQSLTRSFVGDLLIVGRFGRTAATLQSALNAALLITLASVAVFLICAAIVPGFRSAFLGAAAASSGVLLQDLFRHWYIASRSSARLLFTDVAAVVLQVTFVLLASLWTRSALIVTIAWGVGAVIVAIYSGIALKFHLAPKNAIRWFVKTWRDGFAYAAEATIGAIVGYAIVLGLAASQSPSEVALFRVAMSVFGLTSLLIGFARTTLVREVGEITLARRSITREFLSLLTIMTVSVFAIWAVVLLLPRDLGEQLFGPTWIAVLSISGAVMLNRLGATWSVVPGTFLRSMGVTWPATVIRIVVGVVACGLGPVWAVLDGARGAFLAEGAGYFLLFLLLSLLLRRSRKQENPSAPSLGPKQ